MISNRLFFAVWPDQAARAACKDVGRDLVLRMQPAGELTPLPNLHMTLLFLGNLVTPEQERAACAAAAEIRVAPFSVTLSQVASFKDEKVWWIGPRTPSPELLALREALCEGMTRAKVPYERRKFAPHVTVLRGANQSLPPSPIKPISWRSADFALFRSKLGARPSAYEVVKSWRLVARPPDPEQLGLV